MDSTIFFGFVKKMVQKNQYTYNVPPGSSILTLTARREAPSLMGRTDGWDGLSKVSFKFLHTLWVYRLCICILIYEIKIVTNILMGFKISCQVGGRGQKFQIYSR